jgi:hypothetical protein
MATVDKAFRIKNGLVVEGSTATVNGQNVLTEASTSFLAEYVADTIGAMVSGNTESGISVTYQDGDNTLDFDVADFTITLGGDLSGSVTITDLANATLTASIAADSVALGTDTTGNYVASVTSGSGLSVTGSIGEGSTIVLANDDKGSSQNIFKNIAITGGATVVADSNDDTVTFTAGTGVSIVAATSTDTITVTNTGVTQLTGTTNEITVSASTGSITLGLATNPTVSGNLTVTGDLTVNGNTTTLNTETLAVEDNLIVLNSNVTSTPSTNAGIEVERGTSTNASLYWDETADKWYVNDSTTSKAIALVGDATFNTFATFTDGTNSATPDSSSDTFTFSGGTGISVAINSGADSLTVTNEGVRTITGTAQQITASASTGAVTLSLPQDIATTSSPSFTALTLSGTLTASAVAFLYSAQQAVAATANTSNTAEIVDSWSATTYKSAKYIVQMTKSTDIETIELLVNVDGNNNVYITEYADVISNAQLGTTDADYSGGNVRLKVTPAQDGVAVRVHKTLITA